MPHSLNHLLSETIGLLGRTMHYFIFSYKYFRETLTKHVLLLYVKFKIVRKFRGNNFVLSLTEPFIMVSFVTGLF